MPESETPIELTRFGTPVVRVKDTTTGHILTLQVGAVIDDPDRFELSDEPAVDHTGKPLPPAYATAKNAEAPQPAPELEEIFE